MPTLHSIALIDAPVEKRHYGLTHVSEVVFQITGPGVRNPEFDHAIYVFRDGSIITTAEAIATAPHPVDRPAQVGPLAIGDTIRLRYPDGATVDHLLQARSAADPVLLRISDVEAQPVAGQTTTIPAAASVRRCRVCGCTDALACDGGCWWVDSDLCSSCRTPNETGK